MLKLYHNNLPLCAKVRLQLEEKKIHGKGSYGTFYTASIYGRNF